MKKLNLNKTWKLCLQMWKWIAKERRNGNNISVNTLKKIWLQKHGFKSVCSNCFFCQYGITHKPIKGHTAGCSDCPATKVDRSFDCTNPDYHYEYKPIAFYDKLVALNKKRKKRK